VLTQPFLLLRHVESILFNWLNQWNLLEVHGIHPVQYMVNVTEAADRYLITVVNNSVHSWNGSIAFKNASIISAVSWMDDSVLADGKQISMTLAPNDIRILSVTTDQPVVRLCGEDTAEICKEELALVSAPIFEEYDNGKRNCIAAQGRK
jgi:hypothetical protein